LIFESYFLDKSEKPDRIEGGVTKSGGLDAVATHFGFEDAEVFVKHSGKNWITTTAIRNNQKAETANTRGRDTVIRILRC